MHVWGFFPHQILPCSQEKKITSSSAIKTKLEKAIKDGMKTKLRQSFIMTFHGSFLSRILATGLYISNHSLVIVSVRKYIILYTRCNFFMFLARLNIK